MKPGPPRRRVPVWLWVAPLVLGAHLLLFWTLANKKALPLAAPHLPRAGGAPVPTPADFSAREVTERDPLTGETVTTGQEFTVSTRLATPPKPSPAASPTTRP